MLTADQKQYLMAKLKAANNLGANVIVGWRPLAFGIQLYQIPIYSIATRAGLLSQRIAIDGHLIRDRDIETLDKAGCIVTEFKLPFQVTANQEFLDDVEELIQPYVVNWSACRGVALYDIVEFSKFSAFEQIAQIRVLSYFISLAAQRCRALGHDINISKSTTGDGYYVWNEVEGVEGDIALHLSTMLTLAYYYGSRQTNLARGFPKLRCCINFGSHFGFQGAMEDDARGNNYIVGDVTIGLARMMSAALPSQMLVGAHSRDISGTNISQTLGRATLDTASLLAICQLSLEKLVGFKLPGGKITKAHAYLTGSRISDKQFTIKKYSVTDKHGMKHQCYNAKLSLRTGNESHIEIGLRDRDLTAFKGAPMDDQELIIRIQ